MEGKTYSNRDSDTLKLAYHLKIKKLARMTQACATCANLIPDCEHDRGGLIDQLITNQDQIIEITNLFIDELGGE